MSAYYGTTCKPAHHYAWPAQTPVFSMGCINGTQFLEIISLTLCWLSQSHIVSLKFWSFWGSFLSIVIPANNEGIADYCSPATMCNRRCMRHYQQLGHSSTCNKSLTGNNSLRNTKLFPQSKRTLYDRFKQAGHSVFHIK